VVKTIGDEVLYSVDEPAAAVATARTLIDQADHHGLPPLRVGLDHGPVVWFEGDLFGPTVNRAARLVAEAPVGGIAASGAVRDACPALDWADEGTQDLKGVGPLAVYTLSG
jgi:adenylate cyclase